MGAVLVRNHGQSVSIVSTMDLELRIPAPVYTDRSLTNLAALPYALSNNSVVYMDSGDKHLTFATPDGAVTERVQVQAAFQQTVDLPNENPTRSGSFSIEYPDGFPASTVDRPYRVLASGFADPTGTVSANGGLAQAVAKAGTNGTLVLDGIFLVDGLTLLSGMTLDAVPGGTLKLANASNAQAVVTLPGNAVLRNLTIDGNRGAQSSAGLNGTRGIGLRIRGVSDVLVENVQIKNCVGEGIAIDNVTNVTVRDTKVTNCCQAANRKAVQVFAYSGNSDGVTFDHLTVDASAAGGGGIAVTNDAGAVSGVRVLNSDITIGGSGSYYTLGIEFYTSDPVAYPVTDVVAIGNKITCSAGTNLALGVSVGGAVGAIVQGNQVSNCKQISYENIGRNITCTGNRAVNSGYISASAAYASQTVYDITIQGNTLAGTTNWSLEIDGTNAAVSNVLVSGNTFDGTYINAKGTTQNITLSNNIFKCTGTGGLIFGVSATPNGWLVANNLFDLTGITGSDAVILSGGSDITIMNNRFKGGRYGVYGLHVVNNVTVIGNRISDCANDGIRTDAACQTWTVVANAITGCGGKGIVFAGSPTDMTLGQNRISNCTGGTVNTTGAGLVSLV